VKNTKIIVAAVLLSLSIIGVVPPQSANALTTANGSYSTLYFPNCNIAVETGGSVTWYTSGLFGLIARDATGRIIGTLPIATIPANQYLSTGLIISATNYVNPVSVDYLVNGLVLFTLTANSPCAIAASGVGSTLSTPSSSIATNSTPAPFVLRIINCNVAVYDAPNGNPIPGAFITLGQTWFVSTQIPVTNANVQAPNWTEVYVGSTVDGFIPTNCVGGRPAGYLGA